MNSRLYKSLSSTEQNSLLEKLLKNTPHIITVYDLEEGAILFANRNIYEVLGYSEAEVKAFGKNIGKQIVHPDDYEEFEDLFHSYKTLKLHESRFHINRWLTNAKEVMLFKTTVAPFSIDDQGYCKSCITISEDISASEGVKKSLDASVVGLTEVLFDVAHELRHEYASIAGIIDLLGKGKAEEINLEVLEELLGGIQDSSNKLEGSINKVTERISFIKSQLDHLHRGINVY